MDVTVAPWTESFRVRSYEADATGTVTPASLCNYLQEAAGNHAFALNLSVEHLLEHGLTWMLSRLRLVATRLPRWRESVLVETWPSGTHGLFAAREFLVYDPDGDIIVRATTAWLLVDLLRRRPARLAPEILALELPQREPALPFASVRLDGPQRVDFARAVETHWSDIDVNEHVNNVRYIAWVLDALHQEAPGVGHFLGLDADFLGEARQGESLRVEVQSDDGEDGRQFLAEILLAPERSQLARVRTAWRPESGR